MLVGLFQIWKPKRLWLTCFLATFSCLPALAFPFGAWFPAQQVINIPASSSPRADHPQFPSAISISSFHPQFLCNITSSFKSIKKSKSKPALHRSLSYIQKTISSFSLFCIQKRSSSLRSLCLTITMI